MHSERCAVQKKRITLRLFRNENVKSTRKLCAKILVGLHIIIKPTKGALISNSRCFPSLTVAMVTHS